MAKRPIDRVCHTRGYGKKSLPYICSPQLPPAWHSGNGEEAGEKFLYLPVENSAVANPNTV
jgi:hypothetical protein